MHKISFFDGPFSDGLTKTFLTLFSAVSLVLLVSGLFFGAWWAGFGLVLFMSALMAAICYSIGPTPIEQLREKKSKSASSHRAA